MTERHCVLRAAYCVAATAFLLCANGSGAQTPAPARPPKDLVGCYVLTLSEWRRRGLPVPSRAVPKLITLDTLPLENVGWRLVPDLSSQHGRGGPLFPRWRLTRDTVELLWSNGDTVTRVLLARPAAGVLSGYAIPDSAARWADNKRLPTAGAEARRIATASWRGTRLSWDAWYYDYGGPAYVDFLTRRVRGHTVALVFMYARGTEGQLSERALVLESFQVQP